MATHKTVGKNLSPETIVTKAKDLFSRQDSEQSVIIIALNDEEKFFTLDKLAAELWNLIDGKRSLGKIESMLADRYDIEPEFFWKGASKVLKDLQKHNLVRI
jgi:hypothetical protein